MTGRRLVRKLLANRCGYCATAIGAQYLVYSKCRTPAHAARLGLDTAEQHLRRAEIQKLI